MELTRQEMFAIVGEQTLQIAALQKHIATLEAKLKATDPPKVVPIKEASDGAA